MIQKELDKDYPTNYCTGASGGFTVVDFRIRFFLDETKEDGSGLERINKSEIILTPIIAKSISKWLLQKIQEYESQFGVIVEPTINNDIFVKEG